jgi:elongation factor G
MAHVILRISPNERGKGFTFANNRHRWWRDSEGIHRLPARPGIRESLNNGVILGYPVVDLHVDLIGGSSHDVDSNEQAFKIAGDPRDA